MVKKLEKTEAESIIYDEELDIRGETCPYPVVKTKMMLKKMNSGEIVKVIVDYPPSVDNILRATQDTTEALGVLNDSGTYIIYLKKK
jgi:TusA-related sulfurtransferase